MSGMPIISGRQAIAALEKLGYQVVRQKGSHVRLRHPTDSRRQPTTVPLHKELKAGTLRAIIRDAGLSTEDFVALLQ